MRRLLWASGIVVSAVVAWTLAHESEPAPTERSDVASAPERPDPPRRHARTREALRDLMARHREPTRLVKVRVIDCGLMPAIHAEVRVSAGDDIVKGLADDVGVFRARVPLDATSVTATARMDDDAGVREGIGSSALESTVGADENAGEPASNLDVVVCTGATVEGVIRDAAGHPLSDAVVRFGEGQDVAVTDADGEFVLTDSYLTAEQVVVEHASGQAELMLAPRLAGGERRLVEIVVEGGRRVSGLVVDRAERPAPNVPLLAIDGSGDVVARAMADRDGRFWLKKLPPGVLTIRADAGSAGVAEATLAAALHPDDLVLRLSPDRASLTVIWEGAREGTIVVSGAGVGDNADPVAASEIIVKSGEERWLTTPGVYRARVRTADGEVACGDVFLAAGDRQTVRCGAPRAGQLVARVLGPDGRPRAGVSWSVVTESGQMLDGVSDDAGRMVASLVLEHAVSARVEIGRPEPDVDMLSRRNIVLSPGGTTDLGDLELRGVDAVRAMFTERETGTFGGLGGQLQSDPLGVAFARIIRDGPLDRAGVRAGDIVLDINGKSAGQLTEREVTLQLRGQPGSSVALRLMRPGEGQLDVELDRALIDPSSGWVD